MLLKVDVFVNTCLKVWGVLVVSKSCWCFKLRCLLLFVATTSKTQNSYDRTRLVCLNCWEENRVVRQTDWDLKRLNRCKWKNTQKTKRKQQTDGHQNTEVTTSTNKNLWWPPQKPYFDTNMSIQLSTSPHEIRISTKIYIPYHHIRLNKGQTFTT